MIAYNPQIIVHPMLPTFSSHEISNKYVQPNGWSMGAQPKEINKKVGFSEYIGDDERKAGGVVRVKLVIRKQELQKMLVVRDMISEVQIALNTNNDRNMSYKAWFPTLTSIPEVN
ncbi:hypothetical protein STAS_31792 [Striga asiatica]|uniref:Uncharacterized protein n=1 Tax=Striga asiatica TaxID=4170 RepID=A0A5A7R906_STRAF|nr:hypothetical protein STAS_31792 [Striga asiatica]